MKIVWPTLCAHLFGNLFTRKIYLFLPPPNKKSMKNEKIKTNVWQNTLSKRHFFTNTKWQSQCLSSKLRCTCRYWWNPTGEKPFSVLLLLIFPFAFHRAWMALKAFRLVLVMKMNEMSRTLASHRIQIHIYICIYYVEL